MLSLDNFLSNCEATLPPESDPVLLCLFHINQDQWHKAHDIVETINSNYGSWLHGLLHRIEGDEWNARYWYRQAGKEGYQKSISEEWLQIARTYLA